MNGSVPDDAPRDPSSITAMLEAVQADEPGAAEVLFALVYDELRALAAAVFRGPNATLQPTAVVHEAYMKLVRDDRPSKGREHFFALAARAMRQVLVDAARRRAAEKRGGGWQRMTLEGWAAPGAAETAPGVEALEAALVALEEESARQARVVELRYFAGLNVSETAEVLGISERTVKSDWRYARAWLRAELADDT